MSSIPRGPSPVGKDGVQNFALKWLCVWFVVSWWFFVPSSSLAAGFVVFPRMCAFPVSFLHIILLVLARPFWTPAISALDPIWFECLRSWMLMTKPVIVASHPCSKLTAREILMECWSISQNLYTPARMLRRRCKWTSSELRICLWHRCISRSVNEITTNELPKMYVLHLFEKLRPCKNTAGSKIAISIIAVIAAR